MKFMIYGENQNQEIATIRERKITLQLSDADCDRIMKKCGEHGLTLAELLQNFIGDLVCGTYTNGSDERMYAQEWFDRCGFGRFSRNTLLRHLLKNDHDVDDFLAAYDESENYKEHPEDYIEEKEEMGEGEKLWFEEDLEEMLDGWELTDGEEMSEEIQRVRIYQVQRDGLKRVRGEKSNA